MNICLFMTGLFHFELCPQGSSICHMTGFPYFLSLNNIPLCDSMNMGLQIFVSDLTFNSFGYIFRSGIAWSYGSSIFNFLRNFILFSMAVTPFYNPTHICSAFKFFYFARWLIMLSIFSYAEHLFGYCLVLSLFNFFSQFSTLLLLLIWGSSLYILGKNNLSIIYIAAMSPTVLIAFILNLLLVNAFDKQKFLILIYSHFLTFSFRIIKFGNLF